MDMIDEEGDSVMSPVVAQFHDDPRVKTVAAGALTAVRIIKLLTNLRFILVLNLARSFLQMVF
jgi:hypothetical protein